MFKVGDVVVCVDPLYNLIRGREYEIERIFINNHVQVIGFAWKAERFKLKQEQKEEMTYDELYQIAIDLAIRGRSYMGKGELEAAIAKHKAANNVPKPAPVVVPLGEQLRVKTGNTPGTCSYAWRSKNHTSFHVGDVCHARLRSPEPMLEIVLDVAGHYNKHSNKEAYKAFVMWMLVDSPFRSCFVTKSWEHAITTGVQLDVTKSHSQNVASAIALRAGSEFEYRAVKFSELVKAGFSPYVAWIASAYFREDVKGSFTFFSCAASHDVHHGLIPLDVMCKFYKEGFLLADKASNVNASQYTAVRSICGVSEYELEDNDKTIRAFLMQKGGVKAVGQGWDKSYSKIGTRELFKVCEALEEAFK